MQASEGMSIGVDAAAEGTAEFAEQGDPFPERRQSELLKGGRRLNAAWAVLCFVEVAGDGGSGGEFDKACSQR